MKNSELISPSADFLAAEAAKILQDSGFADYTPSQVASAIGLEGKHTGIGCVSEKIVEQLSFRKIRCDYHRIGSRRHFRVHGVACAAELAQ